MAEPQNGDEPLVEPTGTVADPTFLKDEELVKRYLEGVALGLNKVDCSHRARVRPRSVRQWYEWAADEESRGHTAETSPCIAFVERVEMVKSETAALCMGTIHRRRQAGDWRAAVWWLERNGYPRPPTELSGAVEVKTPQLVMDTQDEGCR